MEAHRGSVVSSRTRSSSRPKRKPFSDLTNVSPSSSLLKPKSKSKSTQTQDPEPRTAPPDSRPADPEPAFSSTAGGRENDVDPPSAASTPKPKEAATNSAPVEAHCGSDISGRTRSSSRTKRKPFSDLTNVNLLSSFLKPTSKSKSIQNPNPKSKPAEPDVWRANPEPAFSSTAGGQEDDEVPSSAAFTPKSKEAATYSGKDDNNDTLDISAISPELVKAREKGKEKVVEDTPLLSCPPLGRIRSIEQNVRLKSHVSILHKALTAPRERTKKRKRPRHQTEVKLQKLALRQDFVEKQRAYFAEIDAFELPEEEVSDSDLE